MSARDKARLDWLMKARASLFDDPEGEDCKWGVEFYCFEQCVFHFYGGNTPRQAIDAAMRESK